MKYRQPFGVSDENAGYVDGNPALGIEGSAVPMEAIEHPQREIVNVIEKAGLTPDKDNLKQLHLAIQALIEAAMPETPEKYDVGQYYPFQDEMPRPGMVPLLGLWVDNFSRYATAVEYFESLYGQKRLVSLDEYNARHVAFWHTNADGSKVGWDGEGGVNVFVWDKVADKLLVPDLAGMLWEQTSSSLGVGGTHGDAVRPFSGRFPHVLSNNPASASNGIFDYALEKRGVLSEGSTYNLNAILLDAARVLPTANKVQGRAWGALACVYLGLPAL